MLLLEGFHERYAYVIRFLRRATAEGREGATRIPKSGRTLFGAILLRLAVPPKSRRAKVLAIGKR